LARLEQEVARQDWRRRRQTVEPDFDIMKEFIDFTQFQLRGLRKVNGEWGLVGLACNCKRRWNMIRPEKFVKGPKDPHPNACASPRTPRAP